MLAAKTVLLVSQRPSDYVEMRRCALELAARGCRISFLLVSAGSKEEQDIEQEVCALVERHVLHDATLMTSAHGRVRKISGERWSQPDSKIVDEKPKRPISQRTFAWKKNLRPLILRIIAVAVAAWTPLEYIKRYATYRRTIKETRADIVIVPEDVVGSVTPLIIKGGHKNDVPTLVIPYTIANQQEAFRSLRSQRHYQLRFSPNWLISWIFPRWVRSEHGTCLVRLPAWHILGQEITRTAPPDPWMMNSGFANVIAVESQAMLEYYRAAGIPETKLRVVGAVYDDQLARYHLNKDVEADALRRKLNIASRKPLLVIGGCPDQTKSSPPGFEFADMKDFARRLADVMVPLLDEYEITVRPHPNYLDLGEMLSKRGIRQTTMDTARLVALADLYVAFGSATIRWAIACGIPTINYDVFQYDYDDFKHVSAVLNVSRYPDFVKSLEAMRQNSPERARLLDRARAEAPRWGRLDGKSVDRIVGLIDELCSMHPVPRTAN